MKRTILAVLASLVLGVALLPQPAGAVSVNRTKRGVIRSSDANGNPVVINDDKPWKVFEIKDTTTQAQIVDEAGVAPVSGILHKVCVESTPTAGVVASTDWALVWDTSSALSTSDAGRRLLPPVMRASAALYCTPDINALFTLGLRAANGGAVGGTYIYWRGLGDVR